MTQGHRHNRHVISALALALATVAGVWMGACGDANDDDDNGAAADAATVLPDGGAPTGDAGTPAGDAGAGDASIADASVPDAGGAPAGHTLILGGVAHAPGNTDPLANCTGCHGATLGGGIGPACTDCHTTTDHTAVRGGVPHRPGDSSTCSTCHGPNNAGGMGPACSNCHN